MLKTTESFCRDDGRYVGIEDPETGTMTIVPLKRVKLRPAVCLPGQAADDELDAPAKKKTEQVLLAHSSV